MLAEPQYLRDFRHTDLLDVLEKQHFAILFPQFRQSSTESPISTCILRTKMFSHRSRAHQSGAARVGADKRENFAMRDRARKRKQRAVAAKERQCVGERDKGLLQDVVGLVGYIAERIRDETANARRIAIEE